MAGDRLRVGFQVWSEFIGWSELMAAGRDIDERGFEELWSNDHLFPVAPGGPVVVGDLDGPVWEGWSVLYGWAAITSRARMGTLVSSASYRNPAILVKMATSLDHMTGGRAVLGLGAGWFEREHRAFGFPFPPVGERIDRFAEAAGICRRLLDGETVAMSGDWFAMDGARNDPPPLQQRLPLAIGGSGEKRTLRIVGEYADIWNGDGDDPAAFRRRNAILDEHASAAGRDPRLIERTVGLPPPCIRPSRDEAVAALAAILERHAASRKAAERAASSSPFADTPAAVGALLREYRAAGASSVIFDWPSPHDEATLDALAGRIRVELEAAG
jgi:alkanesulfonate monooxygenase SsuD/methylene tetrahydromethanopterin reductase-like flavin-dependent oxidoreductase (luciferase family)